MYKNPQLLDMGARLVEERNRIGYSQSDIAHQLDISREALRLAESGASLPGAAILAGLATFGIDVQYLLTGVRSTNADDVQRAWMDEFAPTPQAA